MRRGGNAPRPRWSSLSGNRGRTIVAAVGLSAVLALLLILLIPGRVAIVIVGVVCALSVYLLMHGHLDLSLGKKGTRK
jgi:hypothetical protein